MTDTNKILGQSVTLANGTASVLYTAPESTSAVTSGLFTVNTADANCSYSVYAVPNGGSVQTIPTEASFSQLGSDIDGEAANDYSGYSVSLSSDGTILAIGAYGNGNNAGHVRVYEWNGSAWDQKGADIDGEAAGDESGYSVSLSSDGTVVAIGAILNDGKGSSAGHVRVYEWNGSAWVQKGIDIDGEAAGDNSGSSVSLSSDGTILAIGAPANDGGGSNAGHVRVYEWNSVDSRWDQKGSDIDGESAIDYSGIAVSLSADGTIVAIGARLNDGANGTNSGHVRVYQYDGVTGDDDGINGWTQKGGDIDGEAANDYSGYSVSLSSDGTVVAVGAYLNDGANGTDSGHVRVYEWNSVDSRWDQKGADIDGEAASDQSGYSVALSSDGTIVAIGAPFNDGNGNNSGHVRVYEYTSPSTTYSVDSKHALIKSRSILIGEHHEIQRGIVLNSGDALWIEATDEVAVSLYGVEVS